MACTVWHFVVDEVTGDLKRVPTVRWSALLKGEIPMPEWAGRHGHSGAFLPGMKLPERLRLSSPVGGGSQRRRLALLPALCHDQPPFGEKSLPKERLSGVGTLTRAAR